ncbi:hypothetical protein QNO08_16715 [Arthrobacter sp. zg-Y820]|uniref:hypothetical protein n=1 Tax=unclassified Arthrobacter TaxID=235627 RepID=UPI001E476934|nr:MULTISPECIES: hypothetical protein [unclassified Arthrobacter]MCC9197281.1 hypothetical protein [Arthrobacter sp. zg-Y820]MDK1280146.1 hypothetical protein [Arthrobacter sp. zg.Y820]MDK1360717.1 hypothetical protein [Arthrobacter sp. zg-Y1219]WIB09438.1 hypothetical protein QNO08_16715 [Arthrobacter sp. zg-Y820]
MSDQDQSINPGADATDNNLAGTRDEFNDEVTARLVQEAKTQEHEEEAGNDGEAEREDQPALEVDEDSPASEAKPSS